MVRKVQYIPMGDEIGPAECFIQASNALDVAIQTAIQGNHEAAKAVCTAAALYIEMGTHLVDGPPGEELVEYTEERDQPFGFAPPVINVEKEVEENVGVGDTEPESRAGKRVNRIH